MLRRLINILEEVSSGMATARGRLRRKIQRADRGLLCGYEFIRNIHYYYTDCKLTWKQSVKTARNVKVRGAP